MPKRFSLLTLCIFLLVPAFTTVAVEDLGAHRMRGMDEFQQVIDSRCTVCHTRERVDIAHTVDELEHSTPFKAASDPLP